jgi:hypothetical protein
VIQKNWRYTYMQGSTDHSIRRSSHNEKYSCYQIIPCQSQGQGMPLHHTRWTGCKTMPSPMQPNLEITFQTRAGRGHSGPFDTGASPSNGQAGGSATSPLSLFICIHGHHWRGVQSSPVPVITRTIPSARTGG